MSTVDKAKGKAKQAAGDVTGDDRLRNEGKLDEAKGKIKEGVDKVADKISDK
jgi:uncharacterized protein YjbJ (UPF0337 family)